MKRTEFGPRYPHAWPWAPASECVALTVLGVEPDLMQHTDPKVVVMLGRDEGLVRVEMLESVGESGSSFIPTTLLLPTPLFPARFPRPAPKNYRKLAR